MLSNIFKDHNLKHKKSKELDIYLLKEEKNRIKELKESAEHMEKVVDIKLKKKRNREDNTEDPKEKEEKTHEGHKEEVNKNEINFKFAIEKILKHINKPEAFSKCLNLLTSLFLKLDNNTCNPLIIIKILYKIVQTPHKFESCEDRKLISDLYSFLLKNEKYAERKEKEILDIFDITISIHSNIITDDSFKFNSAIKKIEEIQKELIDFDEEETMVLESFEKLLDDESIYDNENLYTNQQDKHNILIQAIKRKLVFNFFKQAFTFYKQKWAFNSINNLLTKAYYEKSKLSNDQFTELDKMISQIRNKGSSLNDTYRDDKIKTTPLDSYYSVSDAREEKVIVSSSDTWQSKQMGLNNGKLFIN